MTDERRNDPPRPEDSTNVHGNQAQAERTPQLGARRIVIGLVLALVVGTALVASIGRLAGFSDLTDRLEGADWRWLAACAVGQGAVFAGYGGAFRSAVAFEDGPQVSPRMSLRVILASFGLTQLVAAGGAAGLALTYWAMRQLGFARRAAVVRLLGLNTAVYLVFALIGWSAAVAALVLDDAPLGMTLPWIAGIPLVFVAASWFTQQSRVERWIEAADGRFRRLVGTGVEAAWWVRRATGDADGHALFRWAGLYWVGDLVSLWAGLEAFGAAPGPVPLALAYATGYLAQSIPIPFIATGGVDAATTFALTAVGVPVEVALLGVVAHRVFAFWLPIAPGIWSAAHLVRNRPALAAA